MTAAGLLNVVGSEAQSAGPARESVMIADEWMRLRSSVMHDWLSAKAYLGRLKTIGLVMQGTVERPGFGLDKLEEALEQWRMRRADLEQLIEEFEGAMSPSTFVSRPPLSRLSGDIREALSAFVDKLWRVRRNTSDLDRHVRDALSECDQAHDRLLRAIRERGASVRQHRVAVKFAEFHRSVRVLHEALSRLPSKIAVT